MFAVVKHKKIQSAENGGKDQKQKNNTKTGRLILFMTVCVLILCFGSLKPIFIFAQENTSNRILELRRQIQELEKKSAEYKNRIQQNQKESKTDSLV